MHDGLESPDSLQDGVSMIRRIDDTALKSPRNAVASLRAAGRFEQREKIPTCTY